MTGADELIGVWSAAAGYYDTFSDELLVFELDGTGRMEFLVVGSSSVHHFRWRVVSPGTLELIGDRHVELGAIPGHIVEGPSDFHFPLTPFSVNEEERPPGTTQRMLVLRIDLPEPYPSELGFVSRNWAL
jgi:hypothetical protein